MYLLLWASSSLPQLFENALILCAVWLPSLFTCKWCGQYLLAATPVCNKLNSENFSFASSSLHIQSPGPTVAVSSHQQPNTSCLHFSIHTHVHSQFCKNIFIWLVLFCRYLTGQVDKRTLEKYEREAKEKNRETWYLSWALDTNQEERDKVSKKTWLGMM